MKKEMFYELCMKLMERTDVNLNTVLLAIVLFILFRCKLPNIEEVSNSKDELL